MAELRKIAFPRHKPQRMVVAREGAHTMWHVEQFSGERLGGSGAKSVLARCACSAEFAATFHSLVEFLPRERQRRRDLELIVERSELRGRRDQSRRAIAQDTGSSPGTYEE